MSVVCAYAPPTCPNCPGVGWCLGCEAAAQAGALVLASVGFAVHFAMLATECQRMEDLLDDMAPLVRDVAVAANGMLVALEGK